MAKTTLFVFSLLALLLAAPVGPARAERVRLGGTFAVLPAGQLKFEGGNVSESEDTAVAYGVGALAEVQLLTNVAIGFAPRMLFRVKSQDADTSAKELDLAVRAIASVPVGRIAQIYGFAAPGYSVLYVPDLPDGVSNPAGFIFGIGAGYSFDLDPRFRLAFELGYQFGAQQVTEQGETADVETSYLHLGVSAMARL